MELDELKLVWRSLGDAQEFVLLRTGVKVERKLNRTRVLVCFELVSGLIAAYLLGSFWWRARTDIWLLILTLSLHLVAIGAVIASIWQLVTLGTENPAESVLEYQSRLRRVRLFRTRMTQFWLLIGPLMWLPVILVLFKGLLGVNLIPKLGPVYVAANLAFGVAFIPLAYMTGRFLGNRWRNRPMMRALMDDLGGRSLSSAIRDLEEIHNFAQQSS